MFNLSPLKKLGFTKCSKGWHNKKYLLVIVGDNYTLWNGGGNYIVQQFNSVKSVIDYVERYKFIVDAKDDPHIDDIGSW